MDRLEDIVRKVIVWKIGEPEALGWSLSALTRPRHASLANSLLPLRCSMAKNIWRLPTFVLGDVIRDKLIPTKIQERNAFGWGLINAEILWGPFAQVEEEDPEYDDPCTCVDCRRRDLDDEALDRALEEVIE